MWINDNHLISHDEVVIAAPLPVDPHQGLRHPYDMDALPRHDRADVQVEVHIVHPWRTARVDHGVADTRALFRSQVDVAALHGNGCISLQALQLVVTLIALRAHAAATLLLVLSIEAIAFGALIRAEALMAVLLGSAEALMGFGLALCILTKTLLRFAFVLGVLAELLLAALCRAVCG